MKEKIGVRFTEKEQETTMDAGQTDSRTQGNAAPPASRRNEPDEVQERQNLRRLQVMMHLLLATIRQDRSITVEDAAQLVANTRNAALRMFPGKEHTYNLLCRPRIQRAMRDRFQIQ